MSDILAERDSACGGCSGPHLFDTSVPSPLWNRVIRQAGLSDYLCMSCIVKAFVQARTSFTAELYGPEVNGERVPRITVLVDDIRIDDSYGDLQARLREVGQSLDAEQASHALTRTQQSEEQREAVERFRQRCVEAVLIGPHHVDSDGKVDCAVNNYDECDCFVATIASRVQSLPATEEVER